MNARHPPPPASLGAAPFLPARATLPKLSEAVQRCKRCELYRHLAAKPFVGPAGALLDRALADARIRRA
jgi:uracil-DNA glycosylase